MTDEDNKKTTMDVEKMRYAVKKVSDTTDSLGQAQDNCSSGVDALGQPWGPDQTGRQFHSQYGPSAEKFMKEAYKMLKGLKKNARQMHALPGEYEKADEENGRKIRNTE